MKLASRISDTLTPKSTAPNAATEPAITAVDGALVPELDGVEEGVGVDTISVTITVV